MRGALIGSVTGAILLLLSTAAYADPPLGVAAATFFGEQCCFSAVVEGDGELGPITEWLPGNLGVVSTCSLDIVHVTTNSANGNINLTCHGQVEFGSEIMGYDFFDTQQENLIPATVAPFDESCDALDLVFPDVCRGNGAAIVNAKNVVGLPSPPFPVDRAFCNVGDIDVPIITFDWRQITTRSGKVALNCQYVGGPPTPTPAPGP